MRAQRKLAATATATGAGLLASAAIAPAWSALLSVAGFGLLAWTLARERASARRAAYVFSFAAAMIACGCAWIYTGIRGDGHNAHWLAALLFAAFASLYAGVYALAYYLVERCVMPRSPGTPWRQAFALASAWVCAEWLRSSGEWAFPWILVGTLHVDNPLVSGLLPLGGVYFAGFAVVFGAALTGGALALRSQPRTVAAAGVALAGVLAVGAWAGRVAWTEPEAAPVEVVLLQSNYPQEEKWDDTARERAKVELLAALRATRGGVLVTPETYVLDAVQQAHGDYWSQLAASAQESGTHVLVGAIYADVPGAGTRPAFYNAVMHVGPARVDVYAKRRLVPFGEYMPWKGVIPGVAWLYRDVFNYPLHGLTAADAALGENLFVAGHEVAPSICYELAFAADTARRATNAAWLVNLSNDAWFDSALYRHQAEQIARTRARETQRWIVRANNVGRTALIAPDGNVQRAEEGRPELLRGQVQPRSGATPYQRWGDWAVAAVALLAGVLGMHGAMRARRRTGIDELRWESP